MSNNILSALLTPARTPVPKPYSPERQIHAVIYYYNVLLVNLHACEMEEEDEITVFSEKRKKVQGQALATSSYVKRNIGIGRKTVQKWNFNEMESKSLEPRHTGR